LNPKVNPPHDPDAEAAVLGALLVGSPLPEFLRPSDFYLESHRLIYGAITELVKRGLQADLVSVVHELKDRGELEAVGGNSFISSLIDAMPDVANVDHWAGIIRDLAVRRSLGNIGRQLSDPGGKSTQELINSARRQLHGLTDVAGEGAPIGPVWRSLREYKEHPELLQPPEEIVPNLAWRGRVTLLAAWEKFGKSTFATDSAAVLSRAEGARVLWVNLEEAPFDVVTRFDCAGADLDGVIVSEHLPARLADLTAKIEEVKPDLVVIDTLGAWGAVRVTDWNSAAQVTPVMMELVALARRHSLALVILHHGKKTDGTYRDSTAIGASVDVIIEMFGDVKDDHVRHFKPRGRWPIGPFSMRFNGTHYEPVAGEVSIHERVYEFIVSHPRCSKRAIRENVPGRTSTKDEAIERLIRDRRIEDRGGTNGAQYVATIDAIAAFGACPDPPEMATNGARHGHGMGTPPRAPKKANGALTGHGRGTPSGTPPVPHPLTGGGGGTVQGGDSVGACELGASDDEEDDLPEASGGGRGRAEASFFELPESSSDWSKRELARLRELVGKDYIPKPIATEMVRKEYAEQRTLQASRRSVPEPAGCDLG
jgi:hypothetical protein